MKLALALVVAALVSTPAHAQDVRYPLGASIQPTGSDSARFALRLRERLRASPIFRVVDPGEQGFRFHTSIVEVPGNAVSYSAVLNFAYLDDDGAETEAFLKQSVGYCATDIMPACAETVVANVTEWAEEFLAQVAAEQRATDDFR